MWPPRQDHPDILKYTRIYSAGYNQSHGITNIPLASELAELDSDRIGLFEMDDYTDDTVEYMSSTMNDDNGSDSTELYNLEEHVNGTIEYHNITKNTTKTTTIHKNRSEKKTIQMEKHDHKLEPKLFTFKCPNTTCSIPSKS